MTAHRAAAVEAAAHHDASAAAGRDASAAAGSGARVSSAAEEVLVREHLPLVGHVVAQVAGRLPAHVGRDELTSAGLLALVLAARSFDPARGVPFAPFALIRIRGALTDELRGMDWASRAVRSKARELDRVRGDLTVALGRAPSREELAAALGCSAAALDALDADVDRASVRSLQALDPDDDRALPTDSGYAPEALLLQREQVGLLHDCIAELPPRLRTVIERYYFQQHKMADIAADLGVTESRVSQLRAEALAYFRAALHAADPDTTPTPTRTTRNHTAYAATVTTRSTLAQRLTHTTTLAEPLALHTA